MIKKYIFLIKNLNEILCEKRQTLKREHKSGVHKF